MRVADNTLESFPALCDALRLTFGVCAFRCESFPRITHRATAGTAAYHILQHDAAGAGVHHQQHWVAHEWKCFPTCSRDRKFPKHSGRFEHRYCFRRRIISARGLERWKWLVGFACTIGWGALVRFNIVVLGFVALGVVLTQRVEATRWRSAAAVIFLPVLVISLSLIRNVMVFHGSVLFSTPRGLDALEGVLTHRAALFRAIRTGFAP